MESCECVDKIRDKYNNNTMRPKKHISPVKLPFIKDKQNFTNNAMINKSLKLQKINRQKHIALVDITKINKIQKQFAQLTKRKTDIQQNKQLTKDQMRQSKLLLLKNYPPQPPKKNNNNLLSSLVEYGRQSAPRLKGININPANISVSPSKKKKAEKKQVVQKSITSYYTNAEELQNVDFVKLFIIQELLYYISKTSERVKDEMAGFCKFYNENTEEENYGIIAELLVRNKDYLTSLFYEKLGFYIYLILGTDAELQEQSQYLLTSLTGYIHTNNLIVLDILMEIVDFEKYSISSQFHVYNTSRFNEDRRKIRHSQDRFNLVAKNNKSIEDLIKSIVKNCGFDSLKTFIFEILNNKQTEIPEKIKEVSLMLVSLDNILTNSVMQNTNKPKPPFLPQKEKPVKYTLVLDMDETLIHTKEIENSKSLFLIRPYCQEFLDEMSKYYELVIFTAAVKQYADNILDEIDEQKRITHRLYREHTRIEDYVSIKDIGLINRDLSKTIIIDNIASNFKLQPRNGIAISTWVGDIQDISLLNLIPVMKKLATDEVNDVRDGLEKLSEFMESRMSKGHNIVFEEISLKGL